MYGFSSARTCRAYAALVLLLCIASSGVCAAAQNVADEDAAYKTARAQTDPEARITSLQAYLAAFPSGSHASAAQNLLLQTCLANFPDRSALIHATAQQLVTSAPAGLERWIEESRIAQQLAAAEPAGVDLPYASALANDALTHLTEPAYQHETAAARTRYKLPRVPAKQLHAEYLDYRASFLAAAAAVELRQHQLSPAAALLTEAYKIQPISGQINALRGELALAQGDSAAALASLERADAMGALSATSKARELQLFQQTQQGDASALEKQVDQVYRNLYPPAFTLPQRQLAPGGHTALLELFTGSGCQPCAGPDLAIDSLLGSYTRNDLVILAWDEPIPRPDPLTNPDALSRAAAYGVGETPMAFLDGQPIDVLGGARRDLENVVIAFADQIEDEAARPSGLHLTASVVSENNGQISVRPSLSVMPIPAAQASVSTGDTTLRKLSNDTLYVALVQDNIRYSGENGIRLHRMVVRSVAQVALPAYLAGNATPPISFNPSELDKTQHAFLDSYEQKNDRFGAFHFTTKDLPINSGDLAIVVWVQDPSTRQILQSTFANVPSH